MLTVEEPFTPLPDQIAKALPALVAFVDRHQCYRFVSRGFEQRFGLAMDEIRGRHVRDVLGDTAYNTVRHHIEGALRGQEAHFDALVPGADGELHRVDVRYSPHRNEAGEVMGYYALIIDLSDAERKARVEKDREQRLELALAASGLGDWV